MLDASISSEKISYSSMCSWLSSVGARRDSHEEKHGMLFNRNFLFIADIGMSALVGGEGDGFDKPWVNVIEQEKA